MLLKCLLVSSFKMKNMGMIAKTAELKPIKNCGKSHENFSKTNGKRLGIAFLGSAQQCSAMLTLQLMPTFLEFLQG